MDKGVILLAGKIPCAKGWKGLSKTSRAMAPQDKELASCISYLVLSDEVAYTREGFGAEKNPKSVEAPFECFKGAPKLHSGPGYVTTVIQISSQDYIGYP